MKDSLAIVMPVYNEEAAVCGVLEKWIRMLESLSVDYTIHVYNDGSKDRSLEILRSFSERFSKVAVHDKPNSGHGPTILLGYRQNAPQAEWLFQMDSDDEMGPDGFPSLWNRRQDYDFLLGVRDGRRQPVVRKVISLISRWCVWIFYGRKTVWDVNSPYRLMRSERFRKLFDAILADTFAPNVIISGMVARLGLRYCEQAVPHGDRKTGVVSIRKWRLFKAAVKSFKQTIFFSFK